MGLSEMVELLLWVHETNNQAALKQRLLFIKSLPTLIRRSWSRRRCGAFSRSTNAQCKREIRWRRYCWQHTPKVPLIFSLVTLILGWGAKEIFHSVFPSPEKKATEESRKVILDRMAVSAELGVEIKNLNLIIAFNRAIIRDLTNGMDLLVSLSNFDVFRDRGIEVLGTVTGIGNAPKLDRTGV
jgi:hypothetical protein